MSQMRPLSLFNVKLTPSELRAIDAATVHLKADSRSAAIVAMLRHYVVSVLHSKKLAVEMDGERAGIQRKRGTVFASRK